MLENMDFENLNLRFPYGITLMLVDHPAKLDLKSIYCRPKSFAESFAIVLVVLFRIQLWKLLNGKSYCASLFLPLKLHYVEKSICLFELLVTFCETSEV